MRVAYLGPEGTFAGEALATARGDQDWEAVPYPTVYDTVMAVQHREVDRGLVPIENSLEEASTPRSMRSRSRPRTWRSSARWSAGAPLPDRAHEARARPIQAVVSHAQAKRAVRALHPRPDAPGARPRRRLDRRRGADRGRVRTSRGRRIGNRLAAEIYGCEILRAGVEDVPENETRLRVARADGDRGRLARPWKTSLVWWGVGSESPGWLVRCLSEFAFRGVNLTKIESRPRKQGLGRYMFFVDLEGRDSDEAVAAAIEALRAQPETVACWAPIPRPERDQRSARSRAPATLLRDWPCLP